MAATTVAVIFVLFLSITICLASLEVTEGASRLKSLQLVQIIMRHGARAPNRPYPNDPYSNHAIYFPEGWGQITKIGLDQQLELGRYLRKRYNGFLPQKYSRYDFHCESSDADRAIQSAAANLAGLYYFTPDDSVRAPMLWQAVPIHTVPTAIDNYLNTQAHCPRLHGLEETVHAANLEIRELDQENLEFIQEIMSKSGLVNISVSYNSLMIVQDCLKAQSFQNLNLPKWATPDVREKLDYFKARSFEWNLESNTLKQLLVGPMLSKLIDNMKIRAGTRKGQRPLDAPFEDEEPFRKMRLFSAHDSTMAYLMIALNIFERRVPPYASALLVEMHKKSSNPDFTIEVYYRNDTTRESYPLLIPSCGSPCYLSRLEDITSGYISDDWVKECQLDNQDVMLELGDPVAPSSVHSASPGLGTILAGILTLTAVAVLVTAIVLSKAKIIPNRSNSYKTFHR